MKFQFSGIADEAGAAIQPQIAAHQELGWKFIELRSVGGVQFTDVTDEVFAKTCEQLAAADLQVSAFASGIANWGCKITDPFEKSTTTLTRAIKRMQTLGTKFIRLMSYPNDGFSHDDWHRESVRRMRELGRMAEDGGIILAVENCDGWAVTSAENYGRYFEEVGSPAVKSVYDTGNPGSHGHTNTWDWYQVAKPHLGYIHIKAHSGPGGSHQWPDAGHSCIRETLADLKADGYTGFVSIEPHVNSIIHLGNKGNQDSAYSSYLEYGRRLMKLAAEV